MTAVVEAAAVVAIASAASCSLGVSGFSHARRATLWHQGRPEDSPVIKKLRERRLSEKLLSASDVKVGINGECVGMVSVQLVGEVLHVVRNQKPEPAMALGGCSVAIEASRITLTPKQVLSSLTIDFSSEANAKHWARHFQEVTSHAPQHARIHELVEHILRLEKHIIDVRATSFKRIDELEKKNQGLAHHCKELEDKLPPPGKRRSSVKPNEKHAEHAEHGKQAEHADAKEEELVQTDFTQHDHTQLHGVVVKAMKRMTKERSQADLVSRILRNQVSEKCVTQEKQIKELQDLVDQLRTEIKEMADQSRKQGAEASKQDGTTNQAEIRLERERLTEAQRLAKDFEVAYIEMRKTCEKEKERADSLFQQNATLTCDKKLATQLVEENRDLKDLLDVINAKNSDLKGLLDATHTENTNLKGQLDVTCAENIDLKGQLDVSLSKIDDTSKKLELERAAFWQELEAIRIRDSRPQTQIQGRANSPTGRANSPIGRATSPTSRTYSPTMQKREVKPSASRGNLMAVRPRSPTEKPRRPSPNKNGHIIAISSS